MFGHLETMSDVWSNAMENGKCLTVTLYTIYSSAHVYRYMYAHAHCLMLFLTLYLSLWILIQPLWFMSSGLTGGGGAVLVGGAMFSVRGCVVVEVGGGCNWLSCERCGAGDRCFLFLSGQQRFSSLHPNTCQCNTQNTAILHIM